MHWLQNTREGHQVDVEPKCSLMQRKGVLLIDDDPFFRALFQAIADSQGIPAATCASLSDIGSFAALKDYDVVVLDYYLEAFRGPEIAEYVDVFFRDLPVLVISGGEIDPKDQRSWPVCIQEFVPKSAGPYQILEKAVDAVRGLLSPKRASNLN
jgi:DNA-binding NtrC family response regulator